MVDPSDLKKAEDYLELMADADDKWYEDYADEDDECDDDWIDEDDV